MSVLQRKLAEFEVKEKTMIEGEHQIESLLQELASLKESIHQYEVGCTFITLSFCVYNGCIGEGFIEGEDKSRP